MRALQCCFRYFPDRGGSETYTSSLISELNSVGVESEVACVATDVSQGVHCGVNVHRLGHARWYNDEPRDHRELDEFVARFERVVDRVRPDVVHMHARSREWSLPVVAAAKMRGIGVVFTYHIATVSCPRGDLMREGRRVCDGTLAIEACHPCKLQQLGVPAWLSRVSSRMPAWIPSRVSELVPQGRLRTALAQPAKVAREVDQTLDFFRQCDRIVVLSRWAEQVVVRNGVSPDKVRVCPLGTHHGVESALHGRVGNLRPLRALYVGRMEASKGVAVLLQALKPLKHVPLSVDLFGPESEDLAFQRYILSQTDVNVVYRGVLPDGDVVAVMGDYDFTLVPSQVPETGPFVVVESLQSGTPVIGSDIGAINEMVEHGRNGLLVPPDSVSAWSAVLHQLAGDPRQLVPLADRANYQRSMRDVAVEMRALYQDAAAR